MGECRICGVDKLLEMCPEEENGDRIVKWKRFEKTVISGVDATGAVKKRIQEWLGSVGVTMSKTRRLDNLVFPFE